MVYWFGGCRCYVKKNIENLYIYRSYVWRGPQVCPAFFYLRGKISDKDVYPVFVVICIGLRIAMNSNPTWAVPFYKGPAETALDALQVATLVFSLLTNILSTGVVGAYVW